MDRNRWKDLIISALGQGGAALLTLLYLRTAVHGFSPEAFGLASAWLGTHTLLRGLLLLPLLQLFLFQHPKKAFAGEGSTFDGAILGAVLTAGLVATVLAALGFCIFPPTASQWLSGALAVGGLALAEGVKTLALNHLNQQEAHGTYAIATLGDSALRLLLLYLCLSLGWRGSLFLVVVPMASAGLWALALSRPFRQDPIPKLALVWPMARQHAGFLLPLMFFAFTSWTTGLADRYLLLQWTGELQTGVYAAIYGLFGTPFPLLISSLVLVFRPRLSVQALVDASAYRRIYMRYMVIGGAAIVALVLMLWVFRSWMGLLFLRPVHVDSFSILPWILLGQGCFAGGQLFELEFYLAERLNLVIIKQGCGVMAALVSMTLLIPDGGIQGAARACACYYGLECLAGGMLFHWHRRHPKR